MAVFSFCAMIENAVLLAKMMRDRNAKRLNDEKWLGADGYIVVEMRLTPPLKM